MRINIDARAARQLRDLTRTATKTALDRGVSERVCASAVLKLLIASAWLEINGAKSNPNATGLADHLSEASKLDK